MGLVIMRRRELQKRAKLWMWRAALQNPPSRYILHGLVRPDAEGRLGIETLLDDLTAGTGLRRGGMAARTVFRLVRLGAQGLGMTDDEMRAALRLPSVRRTIVNAALTIDRYGLRMPQRFYAPLMVVWNFTYHCNLRCKHCYQNAGPLRPSRQRVDELGLEERLAAVEQIAASHIPTVSFSGGEPLIHPDFWPVAERAREVGLYTSIASNGTLITEEVAQRLADVGLGYAGISLDSPDPMAHDVFRGLPGSWEQTVKGIKRLAGTPVETLLAFTITRHNYQTLPEVFRLAEELGMSKVMVYNFIPTGRGLEMIDDDLTPEMREEALQVMYRYAEQGGAVCSTAPQLGRVCNEHFRPDLVPLAHASHGKGEDLQLLAEMVGGCGVGRAYFALQPDGRLTPCVYMPDITIGHFRTDRFLDVWQSHPLLRSLADRSDLKGHCGKCEHWSVCGGCRARAYAYFGDFKAPDPGCINNTAAYYAARELPEDREAAARAA